MTEHWAKLFLESLNSQNVLGQHSLHLDFMGTAGSLQHLLQNSRSPQKRCRPLQTSPLHSGRILIGHKSCRQRTANFRGTDSSNYGSCSPPAGQSTGHSGLTSKAGGICRRTEPCMGCQSIVYRTSSRLSDSDSSHSWLRLLVLAPPEARWRSPQHQR